MPIYSTHCIDSRKDEKLELRWKMGRSEKYVILNKTSIYFVLFFIAYDPYR